MWKSPDIEPLVGRLEVESREIYAHREALAAIVGPRPGAVVADVGAGSGFMALLFARQVGPTGKVIAVDINPKLLELISARAKKENLSNLQTVLAKDDSSELPPNSVDLVFICDTYHHFEFPQRTMESIHRALRPGGQLVVVEFRRVPGTSPEWLLEHVRAGEEVFTKEILDAGFELTNVHNAPFLKENYILRFRKVEKRVSLWAPPQELVNRAVAAML
jgi:ubiquinone/menaquinone biosynthesis C-methylase UbiE